MRRHVPLALAACAALSLATAACGSSSNTQRPSSSASPVRSASASPAPLMGVAVRESTNHQGFTAVPNVITPGLTGLTFGNSFTNPNFSTTLITLKHGATLAQFVAQGRKVVAHATTHAQLMAVAAAVRWINSHTVAYGGNPGIPSSNTQLQAVLPAGTYYAVDVPNGTGHVALQVHGKTGIGTLPAADQTLKMVEPTAGMPSYAITSPPGDKPNTLHSGELRVTNTTNELHMAMIFRIRPGMAALEVQHALEQNKPGPVYPVGGTDVLSPHVSVNLWLHAKPGTYAVVCFVPDDKTGVVHAFMPKHPMIRVFSVIK